MGQRSPHNARYQKYTKPSGKTRRSAASAKPKRDLGKTTAESKSSSKSGSGRGSYAVPVTPEYRKWRNIWWGALGASAGFALMYLALDVVLRKQGVAVPAELRVGLLVSCYICLGVGMYVDWRKVRPARHAALHGGGQVAAPAKKADKPADTSE
jgi:hypothetical protein